jgi:hypothetical protein
MSGILRLFKSTDVGAPALSGIAGSLVTVLDAVLVDGYGSGGDAKSPAGWTRAFTATNKRVYRGDPVAGTGYFLRVDDTGTIGNARHAFLRGYRAMSDIDTGTEPVPTVAQLTNGCLWQKSSLLDGTARAWAIFANDKIAYVFMDCGGNGMAEVSPFLAGDGFSHKLGDQHFFMINANSLTTYTGSTAVNHGTAFITGSLTSAPSTFFFIARAHTGLIGPVSGSVVDRDMMINDLAYGKNGLPYPDPVSLGMLHGPSHVYEAANIVRGKLPGVIVPQHNRPLPDLAEITTLSGAEGIRVVAKSYRAGHPGNASTYAGQVLFDLSTEW